MKQIRRRSSPELTRERIINAAFAVFDNMDFHQATVRKIAIESGLSTASIYKHFKNKEDLINAIAVEKCRGMSEGLTDHLSGINGVNNKIRKMIWFYLNFFETNRMVCWTIYIATPMNSWSKSPTGWEVARQMARIYTDILKEGKRSGELRGDLDIHVASDLCFGALRYICTMWLIRNKPEKLNGIADIFTEMIISGVAANQYQALTSVCPYLAATQKQISSQRQAMVSKSDKSAIT